MTTRPKTVLDPVPQRELDSRTKPVSDHAAWTGAAEATALMLADRLADVDRVDQAVLSSESRAQFEFGWGGASLAAGPAGSALVFGTAAALQPDRADHWHDLAHRSLVDASSSTHEQPVSELGLAGGAAGLACAFAVCSRFEPRYVPTLTKLLDSLAAQVLAAPRHRPDHGVRDRDYDLVTGWAGTLVALGPNWSASPVVASAVASLTDDLVWLCGSRTRRAWQIPPEHYPLPEYRKSFPYGYVNLGMAHGVPGVLAAAALTSSAGYPDDRLLALVADLADYLQEVAVEDRWGRNWTYGVPLDSNGGEDRETLRQTAPSRTAWCYGAPGVACALLLAAEALADDGLQRVAIEAAEGSLRRFADHDGFGSATVCHGAAGLLAVAARFARAGSPLADRMVPDLVGHVLDHCEEDLPLGVQDLEQPGVLLDSPGLLTGSAGVALALAGAARPDIDHGWERALVLS